MPSSGDPSAGASSCKRLAVYEGFAMPFLCGVRPVASVLVLEAAQTGGTYESIFAGIERAVPQIFDILAPALQPERHRGSSEPFRNEPHCSDSV